jgi:hypothetical protein
MRRYVKSISIYAVPAVVPTGGFNSTVTAVVRDQYNNPAAGKTVNWTDDAGGRLSPTSSVTDIFGRASTVYTSGETETDVKVTATVASGLI